MPDIHELDATTVERIAAGEVVERPASVVKELVENSIDAGADRVRVAVEAGGTERIAVTDDGHGMTAEAVRTAVREHTTSKIEGIADLEAGVGTLGFRGEALHAIGAVSRLTVRTRPRGDARGTELVVEGGEVTSVSSVGCPEGTTVEVRDLFFNVPARRKYLKTEATEFAHVNRIATGYALANPGVAVALEHDGRETFATAGDGDRRSAVMAVYGREVAAAMEPVDAGAGELPDGPLSGVSGLVSHPETTRASRDYLNTFVNGRYVTAGPVRDAVVEAYGGQLAADRFPFAVLDLSVPPESVDVNVHPRKLEVRFVDEAGLRDQVRAAVESALLDAGLLRSSAPRGRSQAEQTEVVPESTDPSGHDPDAGASRATGDGPNEATAHAEAGTDGTDAPASARESDSADGAETASPAGADHEYPASTGADAGSRPTATTDAAGGGADAPPSDATGEPDAEHASSARDEPPARGVRDRDPHEKFRETPAQARLGTDPAPPDREHEFERLPPMRVLGQVHETYLVAETPDGLVLVDQHAADERINYERLRERFAGDVATQALADPVEVTLTAEEAALAADAGDVLARLGFRTERVDDRTVRVRTVPAMLAEEGPELVRDLLADLVDGDPADTVEAAVDDLLGDMACYPAITANQSLAEGTVVDLLGALDGCENPWACPHGRPVLVELSRREIEDRFERDYPGHG